MNGDVEKFNIFPKVSGSYRLLNLLGSGSEIKPRIAYGETGNLPIFGQKFTLLDTPQLGGITGFTVAGASGFAGVEPERVKELEVGMDGIAMAQPAHVGAHRLPSATRPTCCCSACRRRRRASPARCSTAARSRTAASRRRSASRRCSARTSTWLSRATYTRYTSEVKDLAGLPPFRPPLSGFGGLGVTFIEDGKPLTQIVGRAFDANGNRTATDVQDRQFGAGLPDGPRERRHVSRPLSLNVVLDYQHGGDIINLTQFLYDDAGLAGRLRLGRSGRIA